MDEKNISMREAIESGWDFTRNNLNFFIPFMAIILFFSIVPDMVASTFQDSSKILSSLIKMISWFGSMFLSLGAIKISLLFLKEIKPKFIYLVSSFELFMNYLTGVILYTLIMLGGLFLFIVPGIILGIKYKYIPFLIIDKKLTPIEALHKSDEITSNAKMKLFLFSMLLIAINIAGFCLFFIGVFITVPVTWLAEAYVYKELLAQSEGSFTEVIS